MVIQPVGGAHHSASSLEIFEARQNPEAKAPHGLRDEFLRVRV